MSYNQAQERNVYVGNDLKDIIEGISDSSITKPYIVKVAAGVYPEALNITIPAYVTVSGEGNVIIDASTNTTAKVFTMSAGSALRGVAIQGHASTDWSVYMGVAGSCVIDDLVLIDSSLGVRVNHADAIATIRRCALLPYSAVMTTGIKVDGGSATITDTTVGGAQVLTNAIWADSSDAVAHVSILHCIENTNVVNALYASNSAALAVYQYDIHSATIGVYALSQASVIMGNGVMTGCGYGIYADGAATAVQGVGVQISDSVTSTLFAGSGVVMTGTGIGTSETMQIDPAATMLLQFLDTFEGDEGVSIMGELHVGSALQGRETCMGEGDSFVNGMLVYTYDGSSYVDVTTAAKSASASTFTYPNLNANSAIYVGCAVDVGADYYQFLGMKFLSTIAQVGGTIVAEYWNNSAWVEFNHMTTESSGDYYRKADSLFAVTAGSYQTRFDPDLTTLWTKNDPPSISTNLYWVRFRITSTLTTAPTFQQIKLHANRTEINADGYPEYMGKARSFVTVSVPWSAMQDSASKLGSQDLYASDNCNAGFVNNVFDTAGDTIGTVFTMPTWVDTSGKMQVAIIFRPVSSGSLTMTAYLNSTSDGDTISTSAPGSTVGEVSDAVTASVTAGQQDTFRFELDISDKGVESAGSNPEAMWLNIVSTTIPGNIQNAALDYGFLSWRNGKHVGA